MTTSFTKLRQLAISRHKGTSHTVTAKPSSRCSKRDGDTANGDEATLTMYVRFRTCSCKNKTLTTALFSQQTGLALHASPELTPMTLMGEQPRPSRAPTPSTTTPNPSRSAAPAGEFAWDAVSIIFNHEIRTVTYFGDGIAALNRPGVALTDDCLRGTRCRHRDGRGGRRQRSRRGRAPSLGMFGVGGGGRKDSEGRDTNNQSTVEHLENGLWRLDSAWGRRAEDFVAFRAPLLYVRNTSNPDAMGSDSCFRSRLAGSGNNRTGGFLAS